MSLTRRISGVWETRHLDGGTKFPWGAKHWSILVLLALSLILGFRTYSVVIKSQGGIDIESVEVALDLSRGEKRKGEGHAHERMPGLPLLLFAVSQIDARVHLGLLCSLDDRTSCKPHLFRSILITQYGAAVGIIAITLLLAWRLSQDWQIVLITLALMALTTRLVDWTGQVRPPIWYHFLLAGYLLLSLCAYQRRSLVFSATSGLILGISCLFEPFTAVLIPVSATLVGRRPGYCANTHSALNAFGLIGGACLGLSLVIVAASFSYDTSAVYRHILRHMAERTAFNELDNAMWIVSLVFPMPMIGDWLAFVVPNLGVTLGVARPGSIAFDGLTAIFRDAMEQGGSPSGAVQWIIGKRIWGAPGSYLWAMLPIWSRGVLAGGGLVALVGLFHVPRMIAYARVQKSLGDLLVVLIPIVVLFAINTVLTANGHWLNPMLVFLYVYAVAYVARGW